jgi:hypothetical protein
MKKNLSVRPKSSSRSGEAKALAVRLGTHVLHIQRTKDGGTLRLEAGDGDQRLEIEVSPNGPVVRLGTSLSITVDGALSIDADTISLRARRAMNLASGGPLTIVAAGDLVSSAESQEIRGTLGDVRIAANDEVVVDGERIKLNCS